MTVSQAAQGQEAYETVIGLEIHAELATNSKMFCGCPVSFGEAPNTRTCPVCLGEPGSLPVVNERAVRDGIAMGLALECRIAEHCQFHRKNYFYPDMPKNYQISQYDEPLCIGGHLDIQVDGQTRRIGVTRVHLEEDTGKTIHASKTGRIHGAEYALENYNRAGIPLMEIVSEPDLRSPEEARAYVVELRAILLALGICDAKMEEGSLRCDANLSLRRPGASELGTKVEVKNVNSLRSLYRALCYEVERQIAALEAGGALVQETRHFDENTGATVPLRSKEEATDYRYFPEPDLVPLAPSREWVEEIRASLSELPAAARTRLRKTYSLPEQDVAVIASSSAGIAFFEELAGGRDAKLAANWMIGDFTGRLNERGLEISGSPVPAAALGELVDLISRGTLSGNSAKEVLGAMFETGKPAGAVVEERGLAQISDLGEIERIAREVLDANPDIVAKFRDGKETVLGALVGQVMRATKGRANPQAANDLLRRLISEGA